MRAVLREGGGWEKLRGWKKDAVTATNDRENEEKERDQVTSVRIQSVSQFRQRTEFRTCFKVKQEVFT